jgi:GTP-binding protein HflX
MVAVSIKGSEDAWTAEESLNELKQLATTAGVKVVASIKQRLAAPSKALYMGSGKIDELITLRQDTGYDVAIFDDELTPIQQRNLEDALNTKVIDRTALILDIFASHARTAEGKLQVELAQHEYLLPRLAGQWSHLERLGGGIGTRGPGESQLETDRRLIKHKIHNLKAKIETVRRQRGLHRRKRRDSGIPVIALVGYTNCGKSSLLNAISHTEVLVEDKLFATLDPTTRRIALPNRRIILLADTVGFIRKLPPTIVTAFRATLEELSDADLIVHIVDMTSPKASEQFETVENILEELGIAQKPRLVALNKIDLLVEKDQDWDECKALEYLVDRTPIIGPETVLISATNKWGLRNLLDFVGRRLSAVL